MTITQRKHVAYYYVLFWIHAKFNWKKIKNNLAFGRLSLFPLFCMLALHSHISDYWRKIPLLMLHLHILIYNSFYGLCRCMVKRKFTFTFDFFFIAFILRWEAHVLIMKLIIWFPDDIGVSSSQLKRFNGSVIDPECLLKTAVTSFYFILFKQYYMFLYITTFIWEVQFTCFPR